MRIRQLAVVFSLALAAFVVCPVAAEEPGGTPAFHPVTDDAAVSIAGAILADGRALCVWTTGQGDAPQTQVMGAYFSSEYDHWFGPRPMVRDADQVYDLALAVHPDTGELWLFTAEMDGSQTRVVFRMSDSGGSQWTTPQALWEGSGGVRLGTAVVNGDGASVGFAITGGGFIVSRVGESDWQVEPVALESPVSAPVLTAIPGMGTFAYATQASPAHRYLRSHADSGASWGEWSAVNLPNARPAASRGAAILAVDDQVLVAAAMADVTRPNALQVLISHDGGRHWPVRRTLTEVDTGQGVPPSLARDAEGRLHVWYAKQGGGVEHAVMEKGWVNAPMTLRHEPILATTVPPLWYPSHRSTPEDEVVPLPLEDTLFFEHVRHDAAESDWPAHGAPVNATGLDGVAPQVTTPAIQHDGRDWVGTEDGLFHAADDGAFVRHPNYGFNGPLANQITGLAVDSSGTLWVATPGGLSTRAPGGDWTTIRGREGLPWKELTAIAIDRFDRIWLGSTRGVILHDPASETRQWYYRAGRRYLPEDRVEAIAVSDDGRTAFVRTAAGVSRIVEEPVTMHAKAEFLEERYNDRHRRLGLSSPALYNDPYTMESWVHGPQPSDGLWTSYHVTATALAYSLTLEDRYAESARESMEAMYLLQNVTGIEGLVARTLVSVDEPAAENFRDATNYHLTADGKYLWRDDVSSDQYDGHFMAFYSYFEHLAQFDPAERARLEQQLRQVLDYVLAHNYTIPDWNAERTEWGWWTPELLNEHPIHWQETGIYALMMLSFLKTAYYITEDETYAALFRELIEEHDYLDLVLLEKKLFPDELNHSDDQLSAVAYYPILLLEYDPFIREALHRACRRHAKVELAERNSLFAFVYALVDPEDADVSGGVQTLREFPRDRRNWRMENSHRRDVAFQPERNRGGEILLVEVLPYDEHHFERWNEDPYQANDGGDGRLQGSGEHYLLPYWIARYHGLITGPVED